MARESREEKIRRIVQRADAEGASVWDKIRRARALVFLEGHVRTLVDLDEKHRGVDEEMPSVAKALDEHRRIYSSDPLKKSDSRKSPWSPQNRISGTGEN